MMSEQGYNYTSTFQAMCLEQYDYIIPGQWLKHEHETSFV